MRIGPSPFAALVLAAAALGQTQGSPDFGAIAPILSASCHDCHDGAGSKGGFDLSALPASGAGWLAALSHIRERVRTGEMPPPAAEAPTAAERAAVVAFCEAALQRELPKLPWPPGRVTVRRLSRGQWDASVRALFGTSTAKVGEFPADDLGYGFDSIGDALSFSTLHLEKYLAAAQDVAAASLERIAPHERVQRHEAESMVLVAGPGVSGEDIVNFYTRSTIEQAIVLPRDGDYEIAVRAKADQAGDEPARLLLQLDGRDLVEIDVEQRRLQTFPLKTPLPGGPHQLRLSFTNDYYDPKHQDPGQRDRNLHVDWLEIRGPLDRLPLPAAATWARDAVAGDATTTPPAFARDLLLRAWRRPPTAPETARIAALTPPNAITAALLSPHFLFRIEPATGGSDEAIADHALAARLSFFLWGQGPDDTLRQQAERGELRNAATLAKAAARMLADPHAEWLATDFAVQWLELRALPERCPDPARFPGIDDELRASMRRQTELLFLTVLREGRDVHELLACDFQFVDARLAAFLGLPAVTVPDFERRPLAPAERPHGGLLGQSGILLLTSNPTRTSPVKRGKWVLENLLDAAPPAPPPGNDTLAAERTIDSAASFREQLAQHRADAKCAGCHVRMDALGFALEHFDAVGRFRTEDRGGAIDARGALPSGTVVDGLPDLAAAIANDPAFVRTVLRKLFVYGVGRAANQVDRLQLDARADALRQRGKVTLHDLVLEVVASPPFRRRGPSH